MGNHADHKNSYVYGSARGQTREPRAVTEEEYEALAAEVVVAVLQAEHAVLASELEAKAADVRWRSHGLPLNPHHLWAARQRLLADGVIEAETARTRGGHDVETFHLTAAAQRTWGPAAARKRLLHGRYLGWASGTKRHPRGLVGEGAERVVRRSLLEAAPSAGYRLARLDDGDVSTFSGLDIPGGPVDSAADVIVTRSGIVVGTAGLLIEVKNIRDWVYPRKPELYQLLSKAAEMQRARPDERFVPVLICRRVHYTTVKMAKSLGFYVIDLRRQYLVPSSDIDDEMLAEVRNELGFADLLKGTGPDSVLLKHFSTSLPSVVERSAERWARSAPHLSEFFTRLRSPHLTGGRREQVLADLRAAARTVEAEGPGGW